MEIWDGLICSKRQSITQIHTPDSKKKKKKEFIECLPLPTGASE